MTYRNDVDALAARHAALDAEVSAKTRERDAARDLLTEARERARLPVLANLRVASPCSADWKQMTGDDRVRACGTCEKRVYNLSELARDEAEALIEKHEGKLCVRYYKRSDGTILLTDCEIGAKGVRRRRWVAAGAIALLAGGSATYLKLRPETMTVAPIDIKVTPEGVDADTTTMPDSVSYPYTEILGRLG